MTYRLSYNIFLRYSFHFLPKICVYSLYFHLIEHLLNRLSLNCLWYDLIPTFSCLCVSYIKTAVKKRGLIAQGGASYPPDDQTRDCQILGGCEAHGGSSYPLISIYPSLPPLKPPLLELRSYR